MFGHHLSVPSISPFYYYRVSEKLAFLKWTFSKVQNTNWQIDKAIILKGISYRAASAESIIPAKMIIHRPQSMDDSITYHIFNCISVQEMGRHENTLNGWIHVIFQATCKRNYVTSAIEMIRWYGCSSGSEKIYIYKNHQHDVFHSVREFIGTLLQLAEEWIMDRGSAK